MERYKLYDWQNKTEWKYKGGDDPCRDIQYVKDRTKFFAENGNGWWYEWSRDQLKKKCIR